MIYLLHGKDGYLVRRALYDIRGRLAASDDMLESNTVLLDGATITPQELLAHATATPFLAANRLVIVEGLLAALVKARGRKKKSTGDDDPLVAWDEVTSSFAEKGTLPESTTLIFVEGELDERGAVSPLFTRIAEVRGFDQVPRRELATWIERRAEEMEIELGRGAAAAIADLLGNDLWAIDRELEKLRTYTDGGAVGVDVVRQVTGALVSPRVFDLTDAVAAGNERKALSVLRQLLEDGDPPPQLAFMLVRQYRQMVLMKTRREQGDTPQAAAASLGINPSFKSIVETLDRLAGRYSWVQLRAAYDRLLEADLSVKRGLQDDESALQLAVHELCALAPRGSPRPAYSR